MLRDQKIDADRDGAHFDALRQNERKQILVPRCHERIKSDGHQRGLRNGHKNAPQRAESLAAVDAHEIVQLFGERIEISGHH